MTSFESDRGNAFDFNNNSMQIWQPDLIVLPIPEKMSGTVSSVQSYIYITNNTQNSFYFNPVETIIPELMTTGKEVLQGFFAKNESAVSVQTNKLSSPSLRLKLTRLLANFTKLFKRSDYLLVEAGSTRTIDINISMFWHNNQLIFRFNVAQFRFITHIKYCLFNVVPTENYQLRFIYLPANKNRSDSNIRKLRITQETKSSQLATSFLNIYLVQPIKIDNAVEVDGIQFETVVAQSLIIPEKKREAEVSLQIGMEVTNKTQTPFRFDFFATLVPELIGANSQRLQRSYFCQFLQAPRESDYPLAMPGESVKCFPDAKLFWSKLDVLSLQIAAGDGGFWIFKNLQPGVYKFRFAYQKHNSFVKINDKTKARTKSLNWKWKTMVSTPFVDLCLNNRDD
ncbi:hypothetical protein NIES25_15160 [Nostoc linckia NIES-25]|nr:hypothetical protein NIES25_15160 [Nostoc linckia NIES-25]